MKKKGGGNPDSVLVVIIDWIEKEKCLHSTWNLGAELDLTYPYSLASSSLSPLHFVACSCQVLVKTIEVAAIFFPQIVSVLET